MLSRSRPFSGLADCSVCILANGMSLSLINDTYRLRGTAANSPTGGQDPFAGIYEMNPENRGPCVQASGRHYLPRALGFLLLKVMGVPCPPVTPLRTLPTNMSRRVRRPGSQHPGFPNSPRSMETCCHIRSDTGER